MSGAGGAGLSDENDRPCACRWTRDNAGRMEFRECAKHYVARCFTPTPPTPDAAG